MKNVVELNYKQAHKFVFENTRNGFFWDGWTIVKHSPNHKAFTENNGMFRKGKWGFANRYKLTDKGTWLIPKKYVENS
jgi:hypothetical protein